MFAEDDLLPLSALQHLLFCERPCATPPVCLDFGQRVQSSVFECVVDPTQWTRLRLRLLAEFNETEDSLRFYFLGAHWRGRVEHHGIKAALDPEGPLIT